MHAVLTLVLCLGQAGEDTTCLDVPAAERGRIVYEHLQQRAFASLDERRTIVDGLKTPEAIHAYQTRQREFFEKQLGGFPERTPLNAKVVGKLEGDGYTIEKILFESRPRHHVTANFYRPEGGGPFPAVVVASGHSRTGKAADYNQRFGIALARHGIAALCYDPIGQGERSQLLTEEGQPRHSSTTREHFLVGVGSVLVGRNTASYRVWDGIRCIDYLETRDDVDPKRIGFTGCSGGGTLTSYVMALDDRVHCAAPACYLTTFRRLIETIGPQDAEQNIFGQVAFGMDHPDYVLMRAPKPTLISSTTDDFFAIDGAWDNARQAKRIYTRLGFPERVDLVEADGKHGVQPENLAAIVRWMRRWLLDTDAAVTLPPFESFEYRTVEELNCVDGGQTLRLPDERSVFDLNLAELEPLRAARRKVWEAGPGSALARVRETAGIRARKEIGRAVMKDVGRIERDGYHIDKIVLTPPGGVPLPALTYHPPKPSEDVVLYLHSEGKTADGAPGGPIEKLVEAGHVVVAVDLRGIGETRSAVRDDHVGGWKDFYLAYLLGRSMVGLRTEDVIACGEWAAYYQSKEPREVHLVGVGAAAIPVLHAAALEPDLFTSCELRDGIASWEDVVGETDRPDALENSIHGVLGIYDLPDLVNVVGNRMRSQH